MFDAVVKAADGPASPGVSPEQQAQQESELVQALSCCRGAEAYPELKASRTSSSCSAS